MPFVRKGRKVYKKRRDGSLKKKGESRTIANAKKYVRILNQKSGH